MFWVLKKILSTRPFFWAPKTFIETDEKENKYNFMLKFFEYLYLRVSYIIGLDKQKFWAQNLKYFLAHQF